MKNYLSKLFKLKGMLIVFAFTAFLLGYLITSLAINDNNARYSFDVKYDGDPYEVFSVDGLNQIFDDINEYNVNLKEGQSKVTYANVDYDSIAKSFKIEKLGDNTYRISLKAKYIATNFNTSKLKLQYGVDRCETAFTKLLKFTDVEIISDFKQIDYINPYMAGGISAIAVLFILIVIILILEYNKKLENAFVDISDNQLIFRTPFHISYWKFAKNIFKNVKSLTLISILFAMMLVCKLIPIPSGFGSLGLSFTYLFFSIISMLYGPLCGIMIGVLSDTIGFLMDGGIYMFGYTLNAMLSGFAYGIAFYKTKITFGKCLYARLFVNIFVNVILGSIWWGMLNDFTKDATFTYMIFISLPKNIIYLLPQSLLLFIVLKAVLRPIRSLNIVDERICDNVSLF